MKILVILLVMMGIFGGCSYLNDKFRLKDDNFFEEAIEDVIQQETGIDIDMTPMTPESQKIIYFS